MIIPMIIAAVALGRSFNMNTIGVTSYYIFDSKEVDSNILTIPRAFTSSQYRIVESSSDVNDFLNVDGELSLKVKNGKLDLRGYGSYLSNTVNRENTIEMLITVNHETVTETFPSYIKENSEWKKVPQEYVGTHYIRSITYGGHLIISYQLKARRSEDMEKIKAAVSANLQMSGSLDLNATGNFEKLNEEIGDKATTYIKTVATAGIISPPTNIQAALQLADKYPEMVRKINKGKGAPLKLELVELSTIRPDYKEYLKNHAMDGLISQAIDKYDDLRVTFKEYTQWENEGHLWNDTQEKMINDFQEKLKLANSAMANAIANLDPSTEGSLDQFEEAFKAYGEGGDNIPNRYMRWFNQLKHKIEDKKFYWFPYSKAISHYIHWGSVKCTLPSTEPLLIGYAGTSPDGFGNGGTIECLRYDQPSLELKQMNKKTMFSNINGLSFQTPDEKTGQVLCAHCKLENATSVFTISGRIDCPSQLKFEYNGYLMTTRRAGTASSFICLDSNPDVEIPNALPGATDESAGVLTPVWMKCSECDSDEANKYVRCAVCSR